VSTPKPLSAARASPDSFSSTRLKNGSGMLLYITALRASGAKAPVVLGVLSGTAEGATEGHEGCERLPDYDHCLRHDNQITQNSDSVRDGLVRDLKGLGFSRAAKILNPVSFRAVRSRVCAMRTARNLHFLSHRDGRHTRGTSNHSN
ncbi:MAG TPA: hypothetical protein VFM77_19620, partial [Terriglobales bacterium]|nr:hypothetical protein [Terriglobales bacterium]